MMWRYIVAYDGNRHESEAFGPYVTGPLRDLEDEVKRVRDMRTLASHIFIIEREGADTHEIAAREARIGVMLGVPMLTWASVL